MRAAITLLSVICSSKLAESPLFLRNRLMNVLGQLALIATNDFANASSSNDPGVALTELGEVKALSELKCDRPRRCANHCQHRINDLGREPSGCYQTKFCLGALADPSCCSELVRASDNAVAVGFKDAGAGRGLIVIHRSRGGCSRWACSQNARSS